tara:strand:- start:353 stop:556 length:204 start_codon:yes stop_codon:yes gene_type:complete
MDVYWLSKMQNYVEIFTQFKIAMDKIGITGEPLETYWFHFIETTCDCEGCREDNKCVLEISFESDDD